MTKKAEKVDVYQMVTDQIIERLKEGDIPWRKPWICVGNRASSKGCAVSYVTGRPYSFINQMLLSEPGEYVTFKQCQNAGGKVRKGAKSRKVVFWKMLTIKDEEELDKDGKPVIKTIPLLKWFNVFHLSDCEGLEPKWLEAGMDRIMANDIGTDDTAETIINDYASNEGIEFVNVAGDDAGYSPMLDVINIPLREQFHSMAEYYATAFHEIVHSTGNARRLNRVLDTSLTMNYKREELIAEIGAASLCAIAGVDTEKTLKNSAAYVQSWIKHLNEDKRAIVVAAGKAEKAVELIMSYQNIHGDDDENQAA